MTTNIPSYQWAGVFGSQRITGALVDRLTYHVHTLEMNGERYCLKRSREPTTSQAPGCPEEEAAASVQPLPAPFRRYAD